MRNLILAALSVLGSAQARAEHELAFGVETANRANNVLNTSPPLPMLYYKPGTYKVTVVPSYFTGELDVEDQPPSRDVGEFKGFGGAAGISGAFADRWGWYGWGVGSRVYGGDFRTGCPSGTPPGPGSCGAAQEMHNVQASFVTVSAGVVYQFFGEEEGKFTLPVFFGPTLSRVKITQTFVDISYLPTETVRSDFDMKVEAFMPGVLVGTQAGIDMGKYFKLNPFLIVGTTLGDPCKPFEVTAFRVDTIGTSTDATGDCGGVPGPGTSGKRQIGIEGFITTIGINLLYKPWGLSANLTAPFLKKTPLDERAPDITLFSVSWSFGNYIK